MSRTRSPANSASGRQHGPAQGRTHLSIAQRALLGVGQWLRSAQYRFSTVTPESQRRVNARSENQEARTLRDVFGWSRPYRAGLLPGRVQSLLELADAVECNGDLYRSRVRYSTLDGNLYVHSSWPTLETDAVFFGPDTHRFVTLIRRSLASLQAIGVRSIVDVGCGSGAGGLAAAHAIGASVQHLVLADVNAKALELAAVNAALAGFERYACVRSDVLDAIDGPIDLLVANPPYLLDAAARSYRHGGGEHGEGLSIRMLREALPRLSPGGVLILYTGSAIVDGEDVFRRAALPHLDACGAQWRYEEIDPDVFGEELDAPACARVERIAAVGLVARLPI